MPIVGAEEHMDEMELIKTVEDLGRALRMTLFSERFPGPDHCQVGVRVLVLDLTARVVRKENAKVERVPGRMKCRVCMPASKELAAHDLRLIAWRKRR